MWFDWLLKITFAKMYSFQAVMKTKTRYHEPGSHQRKQDRRGAQPARSVDHHGLLDSRRTPRMNPRSVHTANGSRNVMNVTMTPVSAPVGSGSSWFVRP